MSVMWHWSINLVLDVSHEIALKKYKKMQVYNYEMIVHSVAEIIWFSELDEKLVV